MIQEQLNIFKLWHVASGLLRRKTSKSSANMTAKTDMHMSPKGSASWNREKEKTWTLLLHLDRKLILQNIQMSRSTVLEISWQRCFPPSVNIIYCNLIIMHADLESSSVQAGFISCRNQHRCWRASQETQKEMGRFY